VNGFVARPTRNAQERLRPRSAAGNTGVATPFTTALLDQPRILPLPPGLGHFITRFIPQLLSKVQGSQGRRECSAHGQYVRPDPHHLHDLLLDRAQALLQGSGWHSKNPDHFRPTPLAFLDAFFAAFSAARRADLSPGPGGFPSGVCFPAYAHTRDVATQGFRQIWRTGYGVWGMGLGYRGSGFGVRIWDI